MGDGQMGRWMMDVRWMDGWMNGLIDRDWWVDRQDR